VWRRESLSRPCTIGPNFHRPLAPGAGYTTAAASVSAQIGIAEAARFPDLTLLGQYGEQSIQTRDLFTRPASIWMLGGNLTAPLFMGGTLKAREQERPASACPAHPLG
jgi:hypothetical protein